jgi:hypothetical protein
MKIKALVTMLVLGSSSLALADTYAPAVRDHRLPAQVVTQPAPAPAPVVTAQLHAGAGYAWHKPIARPVLLANDTRLDGRASINVAQTRTYSKLTLESKRGRTDVDRVLIVFGNGQRQIVDLRGKQNGKLSGNQSLTIDLDGGARYIKSVMLIGSSGRRAALDVIAA